MAIFKYSLDYNNSIVESVGKLALVIADSQTSENIVFNR